MGIVYEMPITGGEEVKVWDVKENKECHDIFSKTFYFLLHL